ncbi:hypothetical protein OH77DRAFT_1422881 [Trametes cingulata]|nr:hypothetical protein OH77DRAFT_1422881 [Trametes cingulata]
MVRTDGICTVHSTGVSSLPVPVAHPSHGPHSRTPLDVPVLCIHDTSGIRTCASADAVACIE